MTEVTFSRSDIEGLAQKLDALTSELSQQEQQLLVAIFAAAANQVTPAGPQDPVETAAEEILTGLREQILTSFVPGTGDKFVIPGVPGRIGPEFLGGGGQA
jgi:hypothetical protein